MKEGSSWRRKHVPWSTSSSSLRPLSLEDSFMEDSAKGSATGCIRYPGKLKVSILINVNLSLLHNKTPPESCYRPEEPRSIRGRMKNDDISQVKFFQTYLLFLFLHLFNPFAVLALETQTLQVVVVISRPSKRRFMKYLIPRTYPYRRGEYR